MSEPPGTVSVSATEAPSATGTGGAGTVIEGAGLVGAMVAGITDATTCPTRVPQSGQNDAPVVRMAPQLTQRTGEGSATFLAPQLGQKPAFAGIKTPQLRQGVPPGAGLGMEAPQWGQKVAMAGTGLRQRGQGWVG